jgi:preprotein translocase subunit SecE
MATMAKQSAAKASQGGVSGLVERVKGWPGRFRSFYDALKREMKLVTWPTRVQVQSTTLVVLITVFLFAFYFAVVDYLLSTGITRLYQYFTR